MKINIQIGPINSPVCSCERFNIEVDCSEAEYLALVQISPEVISKFNDLIKELQNV